MSKDSKIKDKVKKQKMYLSYYEMTKKGGKMPMTYAQYMTPGHAAMKPVKAKPAIKATPKKKATLVTKRTSDVSTSLKRAGITKSELNRLKGRK